MESKYDDFVNLEIGVLLLTNDKSHVYFFPFRFFPIGNNGMRRRHLSSRYRTATRSVYLCRTAAIARPPPRELSHAVLRAYAAISERYGIDAR